MAKDLVKGNHEVTFGSWEPAKSSPVQGVKVQCQRDAVRSGDVVVPAAYYPMMRDVSLAEYEC